MKSLINAVLLAVGLLGMVGCNDNSNRDMQKTDTLNRAPVVKDPQVDKNPTPATGTGGDQQGTEPSQPAAK